MEGDKAINIFEHFKKIKDYELFERERKRILKEFLDRVDNPQKKQMLEALQFAIDREREYCKNSLLCAQRIYQLMLDRGLFRLNEVYQGKISKKAKIIPLK